MTTLLRIHNYVQFHFFCIFPGISYEITTYTSDRSGASTDAEVYVVLYGKEIASSQKPLCSTKAERKSSFKKGAKDTFIVEVSCVDTVINSNAIVMVVAVTILLPLIYNNNDNNKFIL